MRVFLADHDPAWAGMATAEAERLRTALGTALVEVHHIGSTSVPGLAAKPIIDLLPEMAADADIDSLRPAIEALGYTWKGEYGLPRRRYCQLDDPVSGDRRIQAHCWANGDSEITRHLAFRDALRADGDLARAYEARKRDCAALHPDDIGSYCDCKSDWIMATQARALEARP